MTGTGAGPDDLDPAFVDELVGRPADTARERAEAAGWTVRVATPGSMLTLDFRRGRITLFLDEDAVVVRVAQG